MIVGTQCEKVTFWEDMAVDRQLPPPIVSLSAYPREGFNDS